MELYTKAILWIGLEYVDVNVENNWMEIDWPRGDFVADLEEFFTNL